MNETLYLDGVKMQDITKWIDDNLECSTYWNAGHLSSDYLDVEFGSESDKMLFKMRWEGARS